MKIQSQLLHDLSQHGYAGQITSIQILNDLQHSLEDQYRNGLFDESFHKEYLSGFEFQPPEDLPNAKSIIVVAAPQSQYRVTFTVDGQTFPTIAPPTYLNAETTRQKLLDILSPLLDPHGYHVAATRLPMKLLAVHSGLAAYGRNNITFVNGMGSFHRLMAFYTDMPCEENPWQELTTMARCDNCQACIRSCPTGAINPDRFLLHAERCLVFLNEKSGEIPFPAWCKPEWHNCVVGCMKCQSICPENLEFTRQIEEGPAFTADESSLILAGTPADQLSPSLRGKLEYFDMLYLLDILPRNIMGLLQSKA